MFELDDCERLRLKQMLRYEELSYSQGYRLVAGVDEAGRGPLAGPVVAAACVIPLGVLIAGINDSKLLSRKGRQYLFDRLTTDKRIVYGIGMADAQEIDQINILQATIQAMWRAVQQLACPPDCLLIDGKHIQHATIPSMGIVRGDQLSQSIAAASIIAKESRDRLMLQYHNQWPLYGFNMNQGYGTAVHLERIKTYGVCPIHRLSFAPMKSLTNVN